MEGRLRRAARGEGLAAAARSKRWRWSNRIRSRTRWKSSSSICATTSSGSISGRWDYMASLIHFNFDDPDWLLPDRNTIPIDVPFFQAPAHAAAGDHAQARRARDRRHDGALSQPRGSRTERARARSARTRQEERSRRVSWTARGPGIPIKTRSRSRSFPYPNQLANSARRSPRSTPICVRRRPASARRPSTERAPRYARSSAIATACSRGSGASLLDGYMEDLATDRIYRLMIAQRLRYPGPYTPPSLAAMFDEELERILTELPAESGPENRARYQRARAICRGA